jgi:hypothetical protein
LEASGHLHAPVFELRGKSLLYLLDGRLGGPQILENKLEYSETVHQLFIDFKKACDSVTREVLYNMLIKFGVTMKLIRHIKMCSNEQCSKVHIGKHLSDKLIFHIQNSLKQISLLLFNFALKYAIRKA